MILIFLYTNSFSQLTHNTGTLQVGVLPKAYIGHGENGVGGAGVIFGGSVDAMYTAGIMYGTTVSKVRGSVGSFTETTGGPLLVDDLRNTIPLTGFTTNAFFNQISTQTVRDSAAPSPLYLNAQLQTLSNTGDNFVFFVINFTNNTAAAVNNFYAAIFSDFDVGAAAYLSNRGGYDISRKMIYQYGTTAADMKYYGLVALTQYSGSRVTTAFPGANLTIRDTLFKWITTSEVTTITTNGDYRSYIGSGPFNIPVAGTVSAAFAMVVGADLATLQANADLAQAKYNTQIIPVELTSFTAASVNGDVTLNWITATEINNRGFEVERSQNNSDFRVIGFVNGYGTTTEEQHYTYLDKNVVQGKYYYRLKQLDFDGEFEYSNTVEVDVSTPLTYSLDQNYPNPFNPSTKIVYSIAEAGNVKLTVFNLLGQEITTLVNGFMEAGQYEYDFNAADLPSGSYIYKIEAAGFIQARKMLLTK